MSDFTPPQAQVLSDYNSPDAEYGGGRPICYKGADGSRFWATLAKQGGVLKLVVYQTNNAGALIQTWADSGIIGQGAGLVLQGDGSLEAVGYVAYGDAATMRAVPVPGWKPWPSGAGTPGPQGPRGPQGPPGPPDPGGAGLSQRYQQALERLCQFLSL
jgi:hypothetical protein